MDDHGRRMFQREAAERAEAEAGRLEELAHAHEYTPAAAAMVLEDRGIARELEMEAAYLRGDGAGAAFEKEDA